MANVFPQALGQGVQAQAAGINPYQMLLDELRNPVKVANGPSFSPEEVRSRIAQNNQLLQLGILGQVAGDERVNRVGGTVFKQALSDRDERLTDKGIQDPLTGETKIDPEYAASVERNRRGQVLQQALMMQRAQEEQANRAQMARDAAAERAQRAREHDATLRAIASTRANASTNRPGMNKPPTGYRWTPEGDLEMIPGGPAAVKQGAADEKAERGRASLLASIDNVIDRATTAKEQTGPWTTGFVGRQFAKIEGTEAYDLRRTLDTVKANLGFNELTAMRQASPTGGALGQVAVRELEFLQSALSNLDADQSDDQLQANLDKVITHYNNWRSTLEGAPPRSRVPGRGATPGQTPPVAPVPQAASPVAPPVAPSATSPQRTRMRYDPATGQLVPM